MWCSKALLLSTGRQMVDSTNSPFMLASDTLTGLSMFEPDCFGGVCVTRCKNVAVLDMH